MTKLSIQRVFEASKLLSTDTGKEIQELINYVSDFAEQTIRVLSGGVGFADNVDSQIVTAQIRSGEDQVLFLRKTPIGLLPIRVVEVGSKISEHGWYFNNSGEVVVNTAVVGSSDVYTIIYLAIFS